MYDYIKGNITAAGNDFLVIENNGIGYRINTSVNTLAKLQKNDDNTTVFTYLHIREDIMQLYGFSDKEELALFTMLIGISGIGPKAAISVLSAFTPRAVALAIAGNDANELSKAKGIGKKTAQRIILELKDKFKELERESQAGDYEEHTENVVADEARTALMVLGYNPREAMRAVESCIVDNMTVEELIRKCLLDING